MLQKFLFTISTVIPVTALARPPASDFANPIAGFVLIGVLLMVLGHWLKSIAKDPIGSFRIILACIVGILIGIGIPIFLMKLNFDPGIWFLPIWLGGWVIAYKVSMWIAGVKDKPS